VEARKGKVATANKLAVLQTIREDKCVLFMSSSNDHTKNVRIGRK
jgi:hypothetical protein